MNKKIFKKRVKGSDLPSPKLALLGLIPIFLFGYLLLSMIAEKTVEYQEARTASNPYAPAYYPPLYPSNLPPPDQPQKIQTKQDEIVDIERADQDAQEQMQRLKTQREQLKTQQTFFPF